METTRRLMLKKLFELVAPRIERADDAPLSDAEMRRQAKSAQRSAAELRAQIDPVELEKELRTHFGKILCELDHLVDVLAVAALKTKDEHEQMTFGRSEKVRFIPEFLYNHQYRTFSLYWRRVTRLYATKDAKEGNVQSKRLPISADNDDSERAGFYPKTTFSRIDGEQRSIVYSTEDKFQELRFLMRQVSAMRRTVAASDRHATNFFDTSIVYDTQPRQLSSMTENVPNVEEPTHVHFNE